MNFTISFKNLGVYIEKKNKVRLRPHVDRPLRKISKHEIQADIIHDDWYKFHFCAIICIEINRVVSFFV